MGRFREALARGAAARADWQEKLDGYRRAFPGEAEAFERCLAGGLPAGWEERLPVFRPADGPLATRDAGGRVLEALAAVVPNLVGGSADLDPSTRTTMPGAGDFGSPAFVAAADGPKTQGLVGGGVSYAGRNVHFGIREHAMAAILTGLAHHGGVVPYGATFLVFADYMRPGIRLAALSRAHVVYVWTHDSVAVGEDGPTHQPVEQLAGLRAIPDLVLLRPADANETTEAWRVALASRRGPVGIVLSRQKLPVLDRAALGPAAGLARGAYVLADEGAGPLRVVLIATGSEVALALEAHRRLVADGVHSRVVSMPSWELFGAQSREYRDEVLPPGVTARVAVEAGSPLGWERFVGAHGAILGVDRFGASAPGDVVMREYGFTVDGVVGAARRVMAG